MTSIAVGTNTHTHHGNSFCRWHTVIIAAQNTQLQFIVVDTQLWLLFQLNTQTTTIYYCCNHTHTNTTITLPKMTKHKHTAAVHIADNEKFVIFIGADKHHTNSCCCDSNYSWYSPAKLYSLQLTRLLSYSHQSDRIMRTIDTTSKLFAFAEFRTKIFLIHSIEIFLGQT